MSLPQLRKRVGAQPVIAADLSAAHGNVGVQPGPSSARIKTAKSSALARIMNGLFGSAYPADNSSAQVATRPTKTYLYGFHEGDLFTPGTQNYVFEYPFEYPLQTIWGNAFLRRANTFDPEQPPQVYSNPNVQINGLGGLQAGTIVLAPLDTEGQ